MIDSVDLFEGLLLEHATNVEAAVSGRGQECLGLLLKHRYSLDGQESINPLHLRGSDAIVCEALSRVFATEASPLITRHVKSVKATLGVINKTTNWYIYRDIIEEWPCEGTNYVHEFSPELVVKEEYRYLLSSRVSMHDLWNLMIPTGFEDDEGTDEFFIPLEEKVLFAITDEEKDHMEHDERQVGERGHYLDDGYETLNLFWYKSPSVLVPVRHGTTGATQGRIGIPPNIECPGVTLTDGVYR